MKLVFCFDGTGDGPHNVKKTDDQSISNILKLHLLINDDFKKNKDNTFENQKSFYYSGVGTRGGAVKRRFEELFATEEEIQNILDDAKKDLDKFYTEGCKVYVFGFSRGAAIARIFAAKIKEYNKNVDAVEFLGVFDTVVDFGIFDTVVDSIDFKGWIDLNKNALPTGETLSNHIKFALHLVSLDETRVPFQPTLFNQDPRICEIWFPGNHSDIGGGYWWDGLSDITLQFMCDKIEKHLEISRPEDLDYSKIAHEYDVNIDLDVVKILPLCEGKLHKEDMPPIYYERCVRSDKSDESLNDGIPIIHHSVQDRCEVADYCPVALRNIKYKVMQKDGTVDNVVREGIRGLRDRDSF